MKREPIILGSLLIAILVFLLYRSSLGLGFLYYDDYLIIKTAISDPINFALGNFVGVRGEGGFYRPIMLLTIRMDHAIWGLAPFGYHLTNLLLHALNACLVYWVAVLLGATPIVALSSGILFGVLPLNAEAVNWICCRFDLLATAFYLCAILFYLLYSKRGGKLLFLSSLAAFALSLGCKESAVTLPLIVVAWELAKGKNMRRALGKAACYFAFLVPYFILRYVSIGGVFGGYAVSPGRMIINPVLGLLRTFQLVFLPFRQENLLLYFVAMPVIIAAFAAALFVLQKRQKPGAFLVFSLSWFAITLLPVSYILPIGFELKVSRLWYLPAVGLSWLITYLLFALLWEGRDKIRRSLALLLFLVFFAYSAYYLLRINECWSIASKKHASIKKEVEGIVKNHRKTDRFYFVNIPDNFKGCFIGMASFDPPFFEGGWDIRGYQYPVNFVLADALTRKEAGEGAFFFVYDDKVGRFKSSSYDFIKKNRIPFVVDDYYSRNSFRAFIGGFLKK